MPKPTKDETRRIVKHLNDIGVSLFLTKGWGEEWNDVPKFMLDAVVGEDFVVEEIDRSI